MREFEKVDRELFHAEIRTAGQPAVLRGLGADWPAVRAAKAGDEQLVEYLGRFRMDQPVSAIVGEPSIGGRFFYTDDLKGLNFEGGQTPLQPFLERLLRDRANPEPFALAVQSEAIPRAIPGFEEENRTDLVRSDVVPRAWIGNRIRVAPHFDLFENLGIVVAGRRRFTLFPPDQLANLYTGPFELTPAGTPVSLVDISAPDLDRFPRFATAMEFAQSAELQPGDGVYIPYHWWHAVDSIEPFNLFVNYWWTDGSPLAGRPYDALVYGLFALKCLPPEQRQVWKHVFDHYVFCENGDPAEHLPAYARGVLGPATPELLHRMRVTLKRIAQAL